MKCEICKMGGSNMKTCRKCGKTFCVSCAAHGRAPYPKTKQAGHCPYCNAGGMSLNTAK